MKTGQETEATGVAYPPSVAVAGTELQVTDRLTRIYPPVAVESIAEHIDSVWIPRVSCQRGVEATMIISATTFIVFEVVEMSHVVDGCAHRDVETASGRPIAGPDHYEASCEIGGILRSRGLDDHYVVELGAGNDVEGEGPGVGLGTPSAFTVAPISGSPEVWSVIRPLSTPASTEAIWSVAIINAEIFFCLAVIVIAVVFRQQNYSRIVA